MGVHSFLAEADRRLRVETAKMPADYFTLRSLFKMDMFFRPTEHDGVYVDAGIVAVCAGTGYAAAISPGPAIDRRWIGKDVRDIFATAPLSVRIALLDSACSAVGSSGFASSENVDGDPAFKASRRTAIVTSEVSRYQPLAVTRPLRVAVVGAVGSLITGLLTQGAEVRAADLDKTLVGRPLGGITILNGAVHSDRIVAEADVAVITGMTLATGTFDRLVDVARSSNTRSVVFAQTGASLASMMIDFGVDVVVAEQFPPYMFPGPTVVRVYRGKPL